jgi:hypothetical protein
MKMGSKHKTGQLLDIQSGEMIAEGLLEVTLVASLDMLEYEIRYSVAGFRPELDGRKFVLRLENGMQGDCSLALLGDPGKVGTQFEVFVRDTNAWIWQNLI